MHIEGVEKNTNRQEETELETLEDGTLDEHVKYWKPLEPDPQIEGRYQNERY